MQPAEDAVQIDTTELERRRGGRADRADARRAAHRHERAPTPSGRSAGCTIGTARPAGGAAAQLRRRARAAERRRRARVQPLPLDRPARRSALLSPAADLLHGEGRGAPRPRPRPAASAASATISVRRGESDREAVRHDARGRARRPRARALRRGHAAADRRSRPGAAGRGDGRAPGGRPGRPAPRSTASHDWRPGNFAPDLGRLGRADPLRRAAEGRQGLQGGVRRDRSGEIHALLRLARRDARSSAGPTRRDAAVDERDDRDARRSEQPEIVGTVAIVGFPNVGKSTLINRLTESRTAVVHETPGVTRDRKELLCDWNGTHFLLIDTGGVDDADTDPFSPQIAEQARAAIEEADLVLFVVDARPGSRPATRSSRRSCAPSKKPVLVLANKIDDPRTRPRGARVPPARPRRPVPALRAARPRHRRPARRDRRRAARAGPSVQVGDEAIRVAILGRPNVGKSSLLNALVGAERVIVSEVPGHDPRLDRHGPASATSATFVLVDTAGLRRKRKQRQGIEYYSELRALEAAERADVALVLIDASEGIVEQDLAVADVARKAGMLDARRALEVGRDRRHDRGRAAEDRGEAAPAPAADRRLGEDRPRARPAARHDRGRCSRSTPAGSRRRS